MSEALAQPAAAIIWIPLMTCGRGLNDRIHWSVRARITKRERGHVAWAVCEYKLKGGRIPAGPYAVRLARVYSGRERLWDDDNWVAGAKAVRDQIAAELNVNDGNRAAIKFTYDQEQGPRSGVRIEIMGAQS